MVNKLLFLQKFVRYKHKWLILTAISSPHRVTQQHVATSAICGKCTDQTML